MRERTPKYEPWHNVLPVHPAADGVDTKPHQVRTFGNDGSAAAEVVTKTGQCYPFDNYGFIRVRKRRLKAGDPNARTWRRYLSLTSQSFDLVKAVRIDGKPRHKFVLGLGSQQQKADDGRPVSNLCWFWVRAVWRMIRHGLTPEQRRRLIAEMARKGARLPTTAECEKHRSSSWPGAAAIAEIVPVIADAAPPKESGSA